MMTINAAYMTFDETRKGSIEVGKLGDLAILSDDLLTVPAERIRDIVPETTIVGGQRRLRTLPLTSLRLCPKLALLHCARRSSDTRPAELQLPITAATRPGAARRTRRRSGAGRRAIHAVDLLELSRTERLARDRGTACWRADPAAAAPRAGRRCSPRIRAPRRRTRRWHRSPRRLAAAARAARSSPTR